MADEGGVKTSQVFLHPKVLTALSIAILLGIGLGFALNLFIQLHIDLSTAEKVHRLLESIYFIAGITLAALAGVGLRQLQLTREGIDLTRQLAEQGQARESLRLATEQCAYYGEHIVSAQQSFLEKIRKVNGKYQHALQTVNLVEPSFTVVGNTIQIPNFKLSDVQREMAELEPYVFMNLLEGFSIFFVSGMANEEVGYYETAIPFIEQMQYFMPCFLATRMEGRGRYISAITLYERWQKRYITEHLTVIRDNIDKQIKAR